MRTNLAINVVPYEILVQNAWRLTDRKIRSFGNLQNGWRYGEGGPISLDVQNAAIELHHHAIDKGLYSVDVIPGIKNQIQLVVSNHDQCAEFTITSTPLGQLSVEFYHEVHGQEVVLEEGLSLKEAHHRLEEFSKRRWKSSDSSTSATSCLYMDVSGALHSNRLPKIAEYPLLAVSV